MLHGSVIRGVATGPPGRHMNHLMIVTWDGLIQRPGISATLWPIEWPFASDRDADNEHEGIAKAPGAPDWRPVVRGMRWECIVADADSSVIRWIRAGLHQECVTSDGRNPRVCQFC